MPRTDTITLAMHAQDELTKFEVEMLPARGFLVFTFTIFARWVLTVAKPKCSGLFLTTRRTNYRRMAHYKFLWFTSGCVLFISWGGGSATLTLLYAGPKVKEKDQSDVISYGNHERPCQVWFQNHKRLGCNSNCSEEQFLP